MLTGWARPDHVGKITVAMLDVLSEEFFVESKKQDRDFEKLIKISQAAGYQAQLYNGLQKNFDFAKRVEEIEEIVRNADPEKLAMGNSPVLVAEEDLRTTHALR